MTGKTWTAGRTAWMASRSMMAIGVTKWPMKNGAFLPLAAMAKERLPYTYSVKQGRYWRFRHELYGDVRLPGQPGDAAFHEKYAEYLAVVEARRSVKPASKDSF